MNQPNALADAAYSFQITASSMTKVVVVNLHAVKTRGTEILKEGPSKQIWSAHTKYPMVQSWAFARANILHL